MGLEELKKEILEKSQKQAESIIKNAMQEAAKIEQDSKKQIEELKKKHLIEEERMIEASERKEISSANFEVKKLLLQKKQKIIDTAFAETIHQIKKLDASKNREIFSRLLQKASGQIEIATLYINMKDKDLAKDYSWLNADIIGGFAAENKDKSVRVDYSYDTLLQSVRNRHMSEVVKILFK